MFFHQNWKCLQSNFSHSKTSGFDNIIVMCSDSVGIGMFFHMMNRPYRVQFLFGLEDVHCALMHIHTLYYFKYMCCTFGNSYDMVYLIETRLVVDLCMTYLPPLWSQHFPYFAKYSSLCTTIPAYNPSIFLFYIQHYTGYLHRSWSYGFTRA